MTVSQPRTAPSWADDDSDHGLCRNAAQCAACGLLRSDGESDDDWKARIRALWNADESITVESVLSSLPDGAWISRGDLAERMGVAKENVHANVARARARGVAIETRWHVGYRLERTA